MGNELKVVCATIFRVIHTLARAQNVEEKYSSVSASINNTVVFPLGSLGITISLSQVSHKICLCISYLISHCIFVNCMQQCYFMNYVNTYVCSP